MKALLTLILSIWLAVSNETNDKKSDEVAVEAYGKNIENDSKEIKEYKKNLPHYYAEDILCSLSDTMWDADKHGKLLKKFTNTDIKLSGNIYAVKNNYLDGCYIIFKQKRADGMKDGWAIITCYIYDDADIEKALKLTKGDKVTLTGHCSKYPVTGITLNDCHIK